MILELEDILENKRAFGHTDIPPDKTLGDIFDAREDLRKVAQFVDFVTLNNLPVQNWRELKPQYNDRVYMRLRPGFGLIEIPLAAAIAAIITAVISVVRLLMSIFMKPQSPKLRLPNSKDSQSYGWEGIRTGIEVGNVIPVIYGEHRHGGQLLSYYIDVADSGRRQQMAMLIGVGEGPITEIGSVHINGIPIDQLGVEIEGRLGLQDQNVIKGFEQIRNTFADNREFTPSAIVYRTTGSNVEKVELQVAALGGLSYTDNKGRRHQQVTTYSVEYKNAVDSVYTIVGNVDFPGETSSEIWDIQTLDFGSRSTWDVRLTWSTATNTDETKAAWRVWLKNVTEITERSETFSSTALLAVRAVATAQLQGGQPNVTFCVKGRTVNAYNADLNVSATEMSHSPAWNVLDYMTNSRYGMGPYISTADIDLQSFYDFNTYCMSMVPDGRGGLEQQHNLDIILDFKKPHWDHINAILGNYRSALIYSNGKYKIITDRQDTPIRQVFHAGNTVQGKTSIRIGRDPGLPNQINVDFSNRLLEYNRDLIFVQDPISVGDGDPIKDYDISLLGIVRESEAYREGAYNLQRKRDIRKQVTFQTGLEAIAVEPGDFAMFGTMVSCYGMGFGGRVLDGNVASFVADREIEVLSGSTYECYVWHSKTDTVEYRTIANSPGVHITITPHSAFAQSVIANDRYAVGVTSEHLMKLRVMRVSRGSDGTHEITGEEFIPVTVTTPSLITSGTLYSLYQPPPQPSAIRVIELPQTNQDGNVTSKLAIDITIPPAVEAGYTTAPGTLNSVTLAFSHNPVNNSLNDNVLVFQTGSGAGIVQRISHWDGQTRVATLAPGFTAAQVPLSGSAYRFENKKGDFAGFELWIKSSISSAYAFQRNFPGYSGIHDNVPQRQTFNVKIIPYSSRGAKNEVGPWEITCATTGDGTIPDNVSDYSVRQISGIALHTWLPTDDSDISHYEIRDGSTWETAVVVEPTVFRTFFEQIDFFPGDHNYLIKAVDRSLNYSADATAHSVRLFEYESRRLFFIEDELQKLTGTFSGLTIRYVGSTTNLLRYSGDIREAWVGSANAGSVSIPDTIFLNPERHPSARMIDFRSATESGRASQQPGTIAASKALTFSIWLRSLQGKSTVGLRLYHGGVLPPPGNFEYATVGKSWKHYSISASFSAVSTQQVICEISDTDDHVALLAWGAQLEEGSQFTQYVATNTNATVGGRVALGLEASDVWDDGGTWDSGETWDIPSAYTGTYNDESRVFAGTVGLRVAPEVRMFDADGDVVIRERHSADNRTFTEYGLVGGGDTLAKAFQTQLQLTATNTGDDPLVDLVRFYWDGEVRRFSDQITVGSAGESILFRPNFLEIPEVTFTSVGTLYNIVSSVTLAHAFVRVFNLSGNPVQGQVVYIAEGL